MEGKELRFGTGGSALWAAVTTVTSCGAVNAAMESLTGIGSLSPFAGMAMSEVVFGGVGSGLYGMLVFVLLAVFVGGLMVGRTPEFLGKKVEAREMKLATLAILVTPLTALLLAGLALGTGYGDAVDLRRRQAPGLLRDALRLHARRRTTTARRSPATRASSSPNAGSLGSYGITFANLAGALRDARSRASCR